MSENPVSKLQQIQSAEVSADQAIVHIIERAARDPSIDIDKLQRLLDMREAAEQRQTERAFDAAMSAAQAEMRPVTRDANNPQTRSRYATYFAMDQALRPIYTEHGFSLSFNTRPCETAADILVLCRVAHRTGHSREYSIVMPADGRGIKGGEMMTRTHATGSAVTYGQRYLLKMIFNVATGEADDDGNAAGRRPPPPPKPRVAIATVPDAAATVVDQDTGEVIEPIEPYTLRIGDEEAKWSNFGHEYIDHLRRARSMDEVTRWAHLNDDNIVRMMAEAPRVHARLSTAISKVMLEKVKPEEMAQLQEETHT